MLTVGEVHTAKLTISDVEVGPRHQTAVGDHATLGVPMEGEDLIPCRLRHLHGVVVLGDCHTPPLAARYVIEPGKLKLLGNAQRQR